MKTELEQVKESTDNAGNSHFYYFSNSILCLKLLTFFFTYKALLKPLRALCEDDVPIIINI